MHCLDASTQRDFLLLHHDASLEILSSLQFPNQCYIKTSPSFACSYPSSSFKIFLMTFCHQSPLSRSAMIPTQELFEVLHLMALHPPHQRQVCPFPQIQIVLHYQNNILFSLHCLHNLGQGRTEMTLFDGELHIIILNWRTLVVKRFSATFFMISSF